MSDTMHAVLPVPQHLALSTAMSSKLVCCDMWHVCVVCSKGCVLYCMCVTLCLSFTENSREEVKEEGEFSMLSAIDMCAACFAVPVDSAGTVEDKQTTSEFLLTVSSFIPCMLRLSSVESVCVLC